MRKMKKLLSVLWLSLCLMLLFATAASAYIDPSAMTYIIQIVAGVAIAAGAALGFYWRRLKRLFSGRKHPVYQKAAAPRDEDDEGYGDFDLPDDLYGGILKPPARAAEPADAPTFAFAEADLLPVGARTALDRYDEGGGDLEQENRLLRQLLVQERKNSAELRKTLRQYQQKD